MVNIPRIQRWNSISKGSSPKAAKVGEIDTKAPFQSVKAAVSLFGEVSSSTPKTKKRPKPHQAQAILEKEAQFHLALNKLNKLKEQLRGAESKNSETLLELDKAKKTVDELKQRLEILNESKQSILETSETFKDRARKLEETSDMFDYSIIVKQDDAESYKAIIMELDTLKQQLNNVRREINVTLEAKASAIRVSQKAHAAEEAHRHRVCDLNKQISSMKEALANVNSCSKNAEEQHHKFLADKDDELSSCKLARQELECRVRDLKNEHQTLLFNNGPNVQTKLVEINAETLSLEEKLSIAKAAFSEFHKVYSIELEIAKKSLERVSEEKISLQNSVDSLKQELQHVGKELAEQRHKQTETDTLINKIQVELDDKKNVLEVSLVNKTSVADVSDDMVISIEQLTFETERAKQEAYKMRNITKEQQEQLKSTQDMICEMENKLEKLLKQAEEAKAAERGAQDEIKALSKTNHLEDADHSTYKSNGKIKISNEEYNSLIEKIDESEKLADIKVIANIAQVEALISSQKEAAKQYEAVSQEIQELKLKEEEAFKTVEIAITTKSILDADHQLGQIDQAEYLEPD